MDAAQQLMIMQQNAQQFQMQQQQLHTQMHNAPQTLMQPLLPSPSLPNAGVQVIWRCGYDSQNRKVCWRVN